MGMFNSINIASTGLTLQRLRQDIIADNIANVETTRTTDGGPYRRKRVIVEPIADSNAVWRSPFVPDALDTGLGRGVQAIAIEPDQDAELRLVWDPTHPDAIKTGPKAGYVEYPNVDVVREMVDLITASRSYDANIAIIEGAKSNFRKALEIGR